VELFTDRVGAGLERALDGVAEQQRATAANIANASTPGYRAQRVDFSDSLASAMNDPSADPRSAALTMRDAGTPADSSGNSVQLDAEVVNEQRQGLQYQALAQAMSFKLGLWKSAIDR
jgi:flagellar basal-body rod protein FlgB